METHTFMFPRCVSCTVKSDNYQCKKLLSKCLVTLEHRCIEMQKNYIQICHWKNVIWTRSPVFSLKETDDTKLPYFSLFSSVNIKNSNHTCSTFQTLSLGHQELPLYNQKIPLSTRSLFLASPSPSWP